LYSTLGRPVYTPATISVYPASQTQSQPQQQQQPTTGWRSMFGASAQQQPMSWPAKSAAPQQPQQSMSPYGGTYLQQAAYPSQR
jgi:hypothetical protein